MARTRRKRLDRVTLLVLIVFLIVALITAILAIVWIRNQITNLTMTPLDGSPAVSGGEQTGANPDNPPAPTGPLQRDTDPTAVPWNGTSRVTLLVMGLDFRDWSDGTDIPRTDSMILISVDPSSRTAGILSIPRDTWVNVPGMGNNKINTAYRWGEVYKLPGGGPGLAMQTVEELIEVPVDYYALIDFNAFVRFIDEMGGLDMHIREEIVVDPIGPGNTRTLEPGVQALDGATALAYARQRHTANDDFDRSERQQEVIMAIRDQVLQFNMLPTLISKAPRLYQEVASGISTNLTLSQVVQLARLGAEIPKGNIKRGVISPPLQVEYATNPEDGQAILIPLPNQIRILRDEIFAGGPPAAAPVVVETVSDVVETVETIEDENARVFIKNGTTISGLASKTREMLVSLGINVIGEDNADDKFASTTIYDFTGNPSTVKFLKEKLNVPGSHVFSRSDPNALADIEIILGADWANQQPTE